MPHKLLNDLRLKTFEICEISRKSLKCLELKLSSSSCSAEKKIVQLELKKKKSLTKTSHKKPYFIQFCKFWIQFQIWYHLAFKLSETVFHTFHVFHALLRIYKEIKSKRTISRQFVTKFLKLSHILAYFPFSRKEIELDYFHQKMKVVSRVA